MFFFLINDNFHFHLLLSQKIKLSETFLAFFYLKGLLKSIVSQLIDVQKGCGSTTVFR